SVPFSLLPIFPEFFSLCCVRTNNLPLGSLYSVLLSLGHKGYSLGIVFVPPTSVTPLSVNNYSFMPALLHHLEVPYGIHHFLHQVCLIGYLCSTQFTECQDVVLSKLFSPSHPSRV